MCGIVGFSGKKNEGLIREMLGMISYRGPDETVVDYFGGVNIGMNRLSINDLNKNLYPFKYKDFCLVINGEIYNYQELKSFLESKGVELKTTCDAEVILPLYDLLGTKMFDRIEGMFALIIIDEKSKKLVAARDKMGEKHLYYILKNGVSFGSEINTLEKIINIKVNENKIGEFLCQGFCEGEETVYEDVKKIEPGTYLTYELKTKKTVINKFKDFAAAAVRNDKDNGVFQLENLLENAVNKRLVADVPVGSFISGGIDSSLITFFASQTIRNLPTFSVSFPGWNEDETKWAIRVSEYLKTKHTVVECDSKNVKQLINKLDELIDEPIVDPAVIPAFLLVKEARKKVKIVLTGEGADELFGGYPHYERELFINNWRNLLIWLPNRKAIGILVPDKFKKIFSDPTDYYYGQRIWEKKELVDILNRKTNLKSKKINDNLMSWMQKEDMKGYLAEQLLIKTDNVMMRCGVESRAPYLDSQIVNFALGLDKANKKDKYILRKLAEKKLPKEIAWRKKQGWVMPLREWFKGELKDILIEICEESKKYTCINHKCFKTLIEEHVNGTKDNTNKLWSLIVLTKVLKKYG